MMRALLSVTTLLLVVFLVMKLSASQWRTLVPAGPGASAANSSGTSTNAAQQAAQRVQQAIDQGAAQRAEDAASR